MPLAWPSHSLSTAEDAPLESTVVLLTRTTLPHSWFCPKEVWRGRLTCFVQDSSPYQTLTVKIMPRKPVLPFIYWFSQFVSKHKVGSWKNTVKNNTSKDFTMKELLHVSGTGVWIIKLQICKHTQNATKGQANHICHMTDFIITGSHTGTEHVFFLILSDILWASEGNSWHKYCLKKGFSANVLTLQDMPKWKCCPFMDFLHLLACPYNTKKNLGGVNYDYYFGSSVVHLRP